MKNRTLALAGIFAILLGGLGCNMMQGLAKVNLLEGDNAAQAAKKVKEKIGGEAKVIRVELRPDKMAITVRSNSNPKDIDKYEYANGSVKGPEPVQVISMGSLEMTGDRYQTVDIDEIGWAAIPSTIARAKELSKLENADIDLVSMAFEAASHTSPKEENDRDRSGRRPLAFTWRLFVEGPRGRKDFWADKSGKLNETPF